MHLSAPHQQQDPPFWQINSSTPWGCTAFLITWYWLLVLENTSLPSFAYCLPRVAPPAQQSEVHRHVHVLERACRW